MMSVAWTGGLCHVICARISTADGFANHGICLITTETIRNCSYSLEEEFKNRKVIMITGDFAIRAMNYIQKRKYSQRIIPPESMFKTNYRAAEISS